MRDFSKISPSLWHSQRFNSLGDDPKLLYVYCLTCEHQTSAGCFRLPDAYAAADLQWTMDRYRQARADLEAADLIMFDASASVLMVRRWFKHNPPTNAKHLQGIQHILERLPSQSIWEAASAELEAVLEAIATVKAKSASEGEKPASGHSQGNGNETYPNPWRDWNPRDNNRPPR